jgi:hypothetical protein
LRWFLRDDASGEDLRVQQGLGGLFNGLMLLRQPFLGSLNEDARRSCFT